jgi:hypothetical protein
MIVLKRNVIRPRLKDESSRPIQILNQIPKNNKLHIKDHRVGEEELSGSTDFTRTIINDNSSEGKLHDKETIQKQTVITQQNISERIADKDIMFISPKKRSYDGLAILITWRVEFLTIVLLFNEVQEVNLK